ncbi:hypothetical protein NHF50_12765 [Flavobacterium sp. NRK F10]|uniref:hypothetical protein n=1 Tax=Flavobacterium sp. NRK F10 TaxID=2954931 RepID=UPI0020904436|nr:hypothetical protein [Flavobacterium sp. NRK F10]MCO6175917.1 hypothetical protein [Flavobacterium sp. NRK F10]
MKRNSIFLLLTYILISCNNNENSFDASGTFEAVETIISADANGQIKELSIEEGQILKPNHMLVT